MSSWLVYWVLMLDKMVIAAFLTGVVFFGIALLWVLIEEEVTRLVKRMLIFGCLAFAVGVFMPTTKQACVIYLLPKVSNNEQVQQIPDKLLTIMNKKLDEWVEDVRGKK